jgi:lysozyme family protein
MPRINLTSSLQAEFEELYRTCEIKDSRFDEVDRLVAGIVSDEPRYAAVAATVGVPWFLVAAIHSMESGRRFDRHLHNGDRLTARTVHVPAGRPLTGQPPFTWEESARDALTMRGLADVDDWTLARVLYELEGYNGWGYRLYHAHVKSPYLWSFSTHYRSGKYVADGTWSDTAVSRQCGAAVIIRRLEEKGVIAPLDGGLAPATLLRYAEEVIPHGEGLQRYLNTFAGISLRVDGWPGEKTSDAVQTVFGFRLQGDPRGQT